VVFPQDGEGVGVQGSQVVAADSRKFVPPLSPRTEGERLLTVREVAGRLAVSTATIYALCERGQIRHVRISNAIRVELAEVEAFIISSRRRG